MESLSINWWAVLVAAVSNFVIGGIWYSPILFGKAWMRANDFTPEDLNRRSPAVVFGVSFLFCLAMAANLAAFLDDPATTLSWGITAGVLAGLGWVTLGLGVVALFEHRKWSYLLVNGGYLTVSFAVMGAILGGWR